MEKWQQRRAKPKAAAVVPLVRRYPDTLERLEKLAAAYGDFISLRHGSERSDSAIQNHGKQLAFDGVQRDDLQVMLQPGQLVRVNLAGLQAEGVMFQAAVTDAVAHIVKQTSEQPPKYLVKLFRFADYSGVGVDKRVYGT